eukprot:scaffold122302_cov39-Tisochrysis_lutea.AAC.4
MHGKGGRLEPCLVAPRPAGAWRLSQAFLVLAEQDSRRLSLSGSTYYLRSVSFNGKPSWHSFRCNVAASHTMFQQTGDVSCTRRFGLFWIASARR